MANKTYEWRCIKCGKSFDDICRLDAQCPRCGVISHSKGGRCACKRCKERRANVDQLEMFNPFTGEPTKAALPKQRKK